MATSPRPDHLRSIPAALDEDIALPLDGEETPFLDPGPLYLVAFLSGQRRTVYARPVLQLTFDVVSTATHEALPEGTRLDLWCRLGPGGRIPPLGKWARTWKLVAGRRPNRAERRMTTAVLRGKLLLAALRTVTVDNQQNPLAAVNQYSVIDRIVAVDAGGGPRP